MCRLHLPSAYFIEYVPESTWVAQYFCATVVKRDDDFLDRYHAYLREFWYRVCTCRVNADAMCFQPNERKRKRKKKQCFKNTAT